MLGYLVLILLQIALCVFGLQQIMQFIPPVIDGLPLLLLKGALYGVIAWAVGLVGSFVLKGVRTPGGGTAVWAIVGGLLGAAAVIAIDQFGVKLPSGLDDDRFILIAGAILGYLARR